MRKSSMELTCFVPSLKVCPAFFFFFLLSPATPAAQSIVVGHPHSSSRCCQGIRFFQRTFSCKWDSKEFTLKATYCGTDPLFYWLFVSSGQPSFGCSRCGFWGGGFRRLSQCKHCGGELMQHPHSEPAGALKGDSGRICMDDKLPSQICLLGIRKHAADESTMVSDPTHTPACVRAHTHAWHSVCLLLASPPTLSARCLGFTRSWPLGEVRVIHKRVANSTAWNLLLSSQNSAHFADFFFSTNVKEIEMQLVKSHAHPPQPRDTCGARVLFSFSAKINVICDILEAVICQQENCEGLQ